MHTDKPTANDNQFDSCENSVLGKKVSGLHVRI